MKLSPHFFLSEFIDSDTAKKLNIDNTPSAEILSNLADVANRLESIRTLLGHPIKINSGYRCEALNKAVGGAANSAHMRGYAVDIVCPGYGLPLKIIKAIIKSGIQFDKCINERTWAHISFAPAMRKQIFTALYSDGKTFYMPGV